VGKVIVACCGLLCIAIALVLAHSKGGALSMWFSISAIASGGLAGLFLLAFLSPRANRRGIYIGMIVTALFTAWATATSGAKPWVNLGAWNYGWNDLTIGAVGHVVMLVSGYLGSLLFKGDPAARDLTFWKWVEVRRIKT